MNQLTFWNVEDTFQHATLRFADGAILHLTRDEERSVRPIWERVGSYYRNGNEPMVVSFHRSFDHAAIAATQLARKGAVVVGAPILLDTPVTSRETNRVTCPDTLLGRERKRSSQLGSANKGEKGARKFGASRFAFDPNAFHAARMRLMAERKAK